MPGIHQNIIYHGSTIRIDPRRPSIIKQRISELSVGCRSAVAAESFKILAGEDRDDTLRIYFENLGAEKLADIDVASAVDEIQMSLRIPACDQQAEEWLSFANAAVERGDLWGGLDNCQSFISQEVDGRKGSPTRDDLVGAAVFASALWYLGNK